MAGTRCRAWRRAFQPLRDRTALRCKAQGQPQRRQVEWKKVVQELLLQGSVLSAAVGEVAPEEVVGDLTLLVQMVVYEANFEEENDEIFLQLCYLVNDINAQTRLEFTKSSLLLFSHFFQKMLAYSHPSKFRRGPTQEHSGHLVDSGKPDLAIAALRSLVNFLHENGGTLHAEEVIVLINELLPFIMENNEWKIPKSKTFAIGNTTTTVTQNGSMIWKMKQNEYQRLAFSAIGAFLPRAGAMISKEILDNLLQALQKNFENLPPQSQLLENLAASRYYAAMIRCLHLVLSDVKYPLEEHVDAFIAPLCMFFMYGLGNHRSVRTSEVPAFRCRNFEEHSKISPCMKGKSNGLYRPPHLRGNVRPATVGGICSDANAEAGESSLSSDSEQSDNDGSSDTDSSKSSRIRISAILTIQAIARADPKLLHAHWSSIFPINDGLLPRPNKGTLLTALLFDPVAKVRLAAAFTVVALLEGPSQIFLRVAEYKDPSKIGSFTTLSSSLGQIVIQLHTGLVYLISNESHCGTFLAALKALSLLISATPFQRLSSGLLVNILISIQKKAHRLFPGSSNQTNMLVALISVLGACLNVVPVCPKVATFLLSNSSSDQLEYATRSSSLFLDLLCYARLHATPTICIEAFQALKVAVHNYSPILCGYWDDICTTIFEALKYKNNTSEYEDFVKSPSTCIGPKVMCSTERKLFDEKVVYSALKLLDEFLRAMSGFQGTDETTNDIPLHPPSPSELPIPTSILSSSCVVQEGTANNSSNEVRGSAHWIEVLNKHLPVALVSSSPMVRGASLTCFAGLTSWVFSSMPIAQQDFIFSELVNATLMDETPSVRSAACRAIGVLVGFLEVIRRKERVTSAIEVVTVACFDNSLLVRITASWAVANICDALCKFYNIIISGLISKHSILKSLVTCALGASKDGDKVRANAVRALGNIAKFVDFNCACDTKTTSFNSDSDYEHFSCSPFSLSMTSLLEIVKTLISCIQIGNVKVQWNVCHALGNLFRNRTICLREMPWAIQAYKALLVLIQESANFKIRIHAASAIAVPTEWSDYGEAYMDVLQGLLNAVESCDSTPTIPSKLKYQAALVDQLTFSTLHVLSIGLPVQNIFLKDFLNQKAELLHDWLKSVFIATAKSLILQGSLSTMQEEKVMTLFEDELSTASPLLSEHDQFHLNYDERPLPPPREKYWFFSELSKSNNISSCNLSKKIGLIKKVATSLACMFGESDTFKATKFQCLLKEIDKCDTLTVLIND